MKFDWKTIEDDLSNYRPVPWTSCCGGCGPDLFDDITNYCIEKGFDFFRDANKGNYGGYLYCKSSDWENLRDEVTDGFEKTKEFEKHSEKFKKNLE